MNEAQIDPGESAWQWRDPDRETGPYEFDLADLWSPREFRGHVLRCLDRMEKGLIGHPESMMCEIVFDVAAAPVRYLELFSTEDLVPLLSAKRTRTRELTLQVLGRVQPSARAVE